MNKIFPQLDCRKCGASNPFAYFAPVSVNGNGTCICVACVEKAGWLDKRTGNLKDGVEL